MKHKYYLFTYFLLTISCSLAAQNRITKTVYFDFDDDKINLDAETELLSFIKNVKQYSDYHIKIIGHTDENGSDEYNMKLSKNRAEAVKAFIVNNDFPTTVLNLEYLGESSPVTKSLEINLKYMNRRVTLIAHVYKYNNLSEMVTMLIPENEEVKSINTKEEVTITLKKGTKVKIPQNAFCHADGTPIKNRKVDIVFKEAFDYMDIVDEQLFTQTGSEILETGGMIYIGVSQNGKKLDLQEGKTLELTFPKQEHKQGMELFTGVTDTDAIIWNPTGEEVTSKKDELFIQIDMSPLFDFNFDYSAVPSLDLPCMEPYPKSKRIAYPPYKNNYTEEEYQKVYKKYEDVMAAYHEYEKIRPAKIKEWENEVSRRLNLMHNHKKEYIKAKLSKRAEDDISKMKGKQFAISNDKLINSLGAFLKQSVDNITYNDLYYFRKIFKGAIKDVYEKRPFAFRSYDTHEISKVLPRLNSLVIQLSKDVMEEKYRLGYVDESVFTNYIVNTSELGWINCDRFIKLAEDEKMDFAIGDYTEGQKFYLVFKNIKSIIRPQIENNKVVFNNVPKGEKVKIVGVGIKNESAYIATQDITLGSGDPIRLNFEKKRINDFRKILKDI